MSYEILVTELNERDEMKTIKIKLKDLKNNPYHNGIYNQEQIQKLVTSIKNLGILRSFSTFQKGKEYCLVCGHHTKEAALQVLGKNAEVEITVQPYDDDTAVWGMAIENLTQDGDEKKIIEDLDNIRRYGKKTFKNYPEFVEFMKKKGVGVGNHDSDKELLDNNKRKDGQKKRDNNYPEIGSSRWISEWINRKGVIMDFHKISELLRIKDNLAPELYEKMVVGQPHKPKDESEEEDETVFNLTNAKMLSSLGDDHKEQKEVLEALENSNEERMHRVRTRGKVLAKYKEIKTASETGKIKVKGQEVILDEADKKKLKESIRLIREGKKDIGNIELPNIKLPQSVTEITIQEVNIKLKDELYGIGRNLEEYIDKKNISRSSTKELSVLLFYLNSWIHEKFAPFYKEIVSELAKRQLNKDEQPKVIYFEK